ncbi:MAG: hypothetical protein J7518_19700 [Nocardioidaceae bacterium]|nr:hypothetical protein [Nocardioidaceae bacterium]
MNDLSAFRRLAATATIGSFSIAALMGIAALLAGGSFGESEGRVLLTTLIVGCASICMLCYLATAGTRWSPVGGIGAVVLLLPTVTALVLVWGDWDSHGEGLWKSYGVGVVGAVTLAQICLLLALAGARAGLAVVLWGTVALAAVLAILVSGLILGEVETDSVWRVLGVVAILDVLGTLVTISLAKFGASDDKKLAPASDWSVTLPAPQAAALHVRAREAGRDPADLLAEAVDRYLAQPATGASDRVHPA